jgi:hypothetical protein
MTVSSDLYIALVNDGVPTDDDSAMPSSSLSSETLPASPPRRKSGFRMRAEFGFGPGRYPNFRVRTSGFGLPDQHHVVTNFEDQNPMVHICTPRIWPAEILTRPMGARRI